MKKLKHEAELFKAALHAAMKYAEERGAVEFEATDSASAKLLYVYRLLVHDKIIQPLPEDQVGEKSMRHKLAMWYSKQLPKDHPLLGRGPHRSIERIARPPPSAPQWPGRCRAWRVAGRCAAPDRDRRRRTTKACSAARGAASP